MCDTNFGLEKYILTWIITKNNIFLKFKNMTVENIPQNWWEIHNHTKMLEIVFSFVRSLRARQKKLNVFFHITLNLYQLMIVAVFLHNLSQGFCHVILNSFELIVTLKGMFIFL